MTPTPFRRWDWYAALLLAALIFTAAARLSITNWTIELGRVETVALLGTALGLALGAARWFGRRIALWLVFDYGMILLPWLLMGVVSGNMTVPERLSITGVRLGLTFAQLIAAKPITDPIFFVTIMLVLYWFVSMYSAYALLRSSTLLNVLVPPTFAMLTVQYFDVFQVSNRIWILAFYFVLVLLLMGRINILQNRAVWQAKRVFTGSEPEFDLSAGIFAVAIALVVVAWLSPTPAAAIPAAARFWQEVNRPLDAARDRLNNMLAAIEGGSRNLTETYGNSLGLGLSARRGTEQVFSVTPPEVDFPRYYWRMRVYDTYQNGNWTTSTTFSEAFSADQANLSIPESGFGQPADFLFAWKTSPTILMAVPSQPAWVSRDGQVQLAEAGPGQVDVLSWHTAVALQPGDQYRARAYLINPSLRVLRNAGTDYPDWVKQRYLQTPDDLPQDIHDLATSLSQDQDTPYDKATAITNYLRQNITYNLSVPSAPPGAEPLDWFLFTWKSGFCNYYASAEVILLRSAGIPARLAVGYAQGALQSNGTYVVEEQDSHAWPEAYFPGLGWISFEPTTSQPAILRAGETPRQTVISPQTTASPNIRPPVKRLQEDEGPQSGPRIIPYQTIGVWVIILIILAVTAYGLRRLDRKKPLGQRIPQFVRRIAGRFGISMPAWLESWERWSASSEVERAFQAINQSLHWLGKPQPSYATPAERAGELKTLLPILAEDVDILNQQLERTLYSPTPGDPAKADRAAWRIRTFTIRAILQRRPIPGVKR